MISPKLILPMHLWPSEQHFVRYFVQPASDVAPEDVLDPDFWPHVVAKLRLRDIIEVIADDFEIDLRVIRIDKAFLVPRPIFRVLRVWPVDLSIREPELRRLEFQIERTGEQYRAASPDGKTIFAQGFNTKADCEEEMSRLNARYEIAVREQHEALRPTARRRRAPETAA
jgi:hypothetical protein